MTAPTPQAVLLSPVLVPEWADLPWLVHGFSTRAGGASTVYRDGRPGGDLNLGFTAADASQNVQANREIWVQHLARERSAPLVTLRQTHSAIVHLVEGRDAQPAGSPAMLEGDGLLTPRPGLLLGILTADCVPILLVDTRLRIVGAFHAGWRGTLARILEQGVEKMRKEFGSRPQHIRAAIGPAIGACCYTVGEEIRQRFSEAFPYADRLFSVGRDGLLRLNLAEANRHQALAAGLPDRAIPRIQACTACDRERFFSHRAEKGFTGRMLATIGVRA